MPSIYTRKLKEALLGNKSYRKIGDFVLFRPEGEGVGCLTKEMYELMLKSKTNVGKNRFNDFDEKKEADKKILKNFTFAPISDEELDFIE